VFYGENANCKISIVAAASQVHDYLYVLTRMTFFN